MTEQELPLLAEQIRGIIFACSTAGKTLTFDSSELQTWVDGSWFTIRGSYSESGYANNIKINNFTSDIDSNSNYRVAFARVADSNNSTGGQDIEASYSSGSGNTNWTFREYKIWDGETNSNWGTASNWNGSVPGTTEDVLINTQDNTLVLNENTTVENFVIISGKTIQFGGDYTLTATQIFVNEGTGITGTSNSNITIITDPTGTNGHITTGKITATGDGTVTLGAITATTTDIDLTGDITTVAHDITFNGNVDVASLAPTVTTGGTAGTITFNNDVDGLSGVLGNLTVIGTTVFNGNTGSDTSLYDLTTSGLNYSVTFNGDAEFTNAVIFNNIGGVALGNNADDEFMFNGGVTSTASTTTVFGQVHAPDNQTITFGTTVISGDSEIGCTVVVGDVTIAAGETLTLGDGETTSITVDSISGSLSTDQSNVIFNSTGSITVNGSIGGSGVDDTIDDIIMASSSNATFTGDVTAATLSLQDDSGVTTFNGALNLTTLEVTGTVNLSDKSRSLTNIKLLGNTEIDLNEGDLTVTNLISKTNPYNITFSSTGNVTISTVSNIGSGSGAALTINNTGLTTFTGTVDTNSGIIGNFSSNIKFMDDVTLGDGDTGTNLAGTVTLDGLTFSGYDGITFGTTTLSAASTVISNNSDITMGQITGSGIALTVNSGTADIDLSNSSNIIGGLTITGNNANIAENDNITQGGAWDVNGTLTLNSGSSNDILLTNTSNDFTGMVTASGNDITLYDTNAMLLGNITASSGGIFSLSAGGDVTQSESSAITADSLLLSGAGNYTLTNTGNNIGTIAADGSGAVSYTENTDFEIGTVGSTNGINIGGLLTLSHSSNNTVSQSQTITAGGLNLQGGGTFNLNGAETTVNGAVTIADSTTLNIGSQTVNVTGDWTNSGIFNVDKGTVVFNGTSEQQITSNESEFYGLTINNTAGAVLADNTAVDKQLTLTAGLLTLGAYRLTLNESSTISGTPSSSNMIVTNSTGSVRKKFSSAGSFLMPIGTNSTTAEYSPVTVNFTEGTFAAGAYAEARVVNEKEPNNTTTTNYLNRYWVVESGGISSMKADVTCQYVENDVVGTESEIYFAEYVDSNWVIYDEANVENHTISGTAMTSFSSSITGLQNNPTPSPVPNINNGMMINDSTDFHTYTSWRNEIDDGPADSIDSNEGFEPNQLEGIGLMLDSLITFDVSVGSVANGEYSMGADATGHGVTSYDGEYNVTSPEAGSVDDGEYDADSRNEYIGGASDNTQEFNAEYDGIADLTFNFDNEYIINHEAIAAYEDRHPIFKTELDLLLEKF